MSYPKQSSVSKRLHKDVLRALDAYITRWQLRLTRIWNRTRSELRSAIRDAYVAVPGTNRWSLTTFRMSGAEERLNATVRGILARFRAETVVEIRQALKSIKWASSLRHAWMLDQLTPGTNTVKLPQKPEGLREAVQFVSGADWDERWSLWIDSYNQALMANLRHNAINSSPVEDAVDEIDATKMNTPSSTLDNAMRRLFEYSSVAATAAGEDDIVQMNGGLVEEEIWRTRGDMQACDECNDNEGLTVEETDGDIPLHPDCHCYWEVVPKSFAKLLRSGDEQDMALAELMQSRGLAPESMIVRNDNGEIAGRVMVTFERWMNGMEKAVGMVQ